MFKDREREKTSDELITEDIHNYTLHQLSSLMVEVVQEIANREDKDDRSKTA